LQKDWDYWNSQNSSRNHNRRLNHKIRPTTLRNATKRERWQWRAGC
jgi:hypothetical protein